MHAEGLSKSDYFSQRLVAISIVEGLVENGFYNAILVSGQNMAVCQQVHNFQHRLLKHHQFFQALVGLRRLQCVHFYGRTPSFSVVFR